jgi:hypothetical protein
VEVRENGAEVGEGEEAVEEGGVRRVDDTGVGFECVVLNEVEEVGLHRETLGSTIGDEGVDAPQVADGEEVRSMRERDRRDGGEVAVEEVERGEGGERAEERRCVLNGFEACSRAKVKMAEVLEVLQLLRARFAGDP